MQTPRIISGFPCRPYSGNGDILVCWPEGMGELARSEAEHHDHDDEDPVEVHQLNAWRNRYYHGRMRDRLKALPRDALLLEVGAGSGYDARELFRDYRLVLTDVSPETLNRTAPTLGTERIAYVAADAEHLPFEDAQFDAVYMAAVFHHIERPERALSEFARVLKPGGLVYIAMEPNAFYFSRVHRFQKVLYKLTKTDVHHISQADANMEGFSYRGLRELFGAGVWSDVSVYPAWLFAGWFHYIAEFFFRAFKLKKRIVLPLFVEKIVVAVDEALFAVPGFRHLGWHWNISVRKK